MYEPNGLEGSPNHEESIRSVTCLLNVAGLLAEEDDISALAGSADTPGIGADYLSRRTAIDVLYRGDLESLLQ